MSTAGTARATRPGSDRAGRPLSTRERRPGWVVAAIALVAGGIFLGAYLYVQAGSKTAVVVVVSKVPAGHTITRADLSTVNIAGAVTAVGADHLQQVVGQRAAVTLLPHMLMQDSMISTTDSLQAGEVRVGVALTSGQIPAEGVEAGDRVEVLQMPGSSGSSSDTTSSAQVLVASATVWSSRADPARSGGTLLTLIIPTDQAADVAAASGAGQIAVATVSPPS